MAVPPNAFPPMFLFSQQWCVDAHILNFCSPFFK